MLNDEGGREKNGMYLLWGGSQGIQEGEKCVNGGGGGGGAKVDTEGGAGVIFVTHLLNIDGHATCKCTYTHKHIHTHTHMLK